MTSWDPLGAVTRWISLAPGFEPGAENSAWESLRAVSSRDRGTPITDHRTSWVRRMEIGSVDCYVKTYDYPTWRSRARGIFRNTALARSRVAREVGALQWLTEHGFGGPKIYVAGEERRLGCLARAVLVTEAWPGEDLARRLPNAAPAEREALLTALAEFVERLHRAGFRDGNLDLRNLLARPTSDGWEIVKIDSPRFRLRAAGRADDRWAAQDRERLTRSLAELGLRLDF